MKKFSRTCSMVAAIAAAFIIVAPPTQAATAVFITPQSPSPASVSALSTHGDNAGFELSLGQSLALLFSEPIVATAGPRTSIFTIAPSTGRIDVIIRAGLFNGGAPIILGERSVRAGGSVDLVGAVRTTCTLLGGCDYLEFMLGNARNGANSATIDYVTIGGELVQASAPDPVGDIASPTPEPQVWVFLIMGFALVAWRMKARRRAGLTPLPA